MLKEDDDLYEALRWLIAQVKVFYFPIVEKR